MIKMLLHSVLIKALILALGPYQPEPEGRGLIQSTRAEIRAGIKDTV